VVSAALARETTQIVSCQAMQVVQILDTTEHEIDYVMLSQQKEWVMMDSDLRNMGTSACIGISGKSTIITYYSPKAGW
jgi:hypothetical protein